MAQYNVFVSFTYLQHLHAIVKVGMLDTGAEVLCFDHQPGETKVYKNFYLPLLLQALMISMNEWWGWLGVNLFVWSYLYTCGLLFVRARTVN